MKYTINLAESKKVNGHTLYRIYANSFFITVSGRMIFSGDRGGWVESDGNLSQRGRCWIADEAAVYGEAIVCVDAIVMDQAQVSGRATVCGKTWVCGHAQVGGDRLLTGAQVIIG